MSSEVVPLWEEDRVTLAEASKLFTSRPSLSTLKRWTREGYRGIKLEHYREGASIMTSHQAVLRFIERTNALNC